MPLLISARDIEAVMLASDPKEVMKRMVDAVAEAFREAGRAPHHNHPRRRLNVHHDNGRQVRVGTFVGAIPSAGYMGLLVRADDYQLFESRITYHESFIRGYHILYSTENAEPLAVIYGGTGRDATVRQAAVAAHTLRTAATTAVGTRAVARREARSLGLFGAGFFAPGHLLALDTCFDLETIKVFSPTREKREHVCAEMTALLGREVTPVASPEEAVRGSDLIVTVTSANTPVFDGNWLQPGQHITGLVAENKEMFGEQKSGRREIDITAIGNSQVIVVNSRAGLKQEQQPTLWEPLQLGLIKWEQIRELGDVLLHPLQRPDEAISFYHNNAGQGVADVAVGGVLYELAKEAGLGVELEL